MSLSAPKMPGPDDPAAGSGQFDGIVIRSNASGEADRVLHILTLQRGKISVFARGIRKSKRRFAGDLEVFDSGVFEIKNGRGTLPILVGFEPKAALRAVRESFDKLAAASLLCECVDLLVKEQQILDREHENIFEDVTLTLQAIEEARDLPEICRALYMGLSSTLSLTGFLDKDLSRPPSKNNLLDLLLAVENCVERRLVSKAVFVESMKGLVPRD